MTSFDVAAPDQIIKPKFKLSEVCRNCKGLWLVLVEKFGLTGEKEGHRTVTDMLFNDLKEMQDSVINQAQ